MRCLAPFPLSHAYALGQYEQFKTIKTTWVTDLELDVSYPTLTPERLERDVKPEVTRDVKPDVKRDVKPVVKRDVKPDVNRDVKPDPRRLKASGKPDLKPDLKDLKASRASPREHNGFSG